MQLVKKNLVSIICGVIALLAVIAIFWPISGWYKDLQKNVDDRAKVSGQISQILNNPHPLPQITPAAPGGDTKTLEKEVFPTRQVIDAWKGAVDKLKQDSVDMLGAAVEMNKHDLLQPNSLPTPDPAALVGYRRTYQQEMNFSITARANSMPVRILHGGFVPTQQDINDKMTEVQKAFQEQTGGSTSDRESADALASRKAGVPDELRKNRADGCLMYLEPTNVVDPWPALINLGGTGSPDPQMIYISQVGYWIQKDIYESLAAANKGAANVRESAVKHLLSLKLSQDSFARMQAGIAPPGAAPDSGQWPQQPNFVASITGRDSNSIYDVYRFDLTIYADAEKVPLVLQELSRGKFVTVTSCSLVAIDLGESQAKGYLYGDKPVVQLTISGEDLFLRQWTKPLMPTIVRTALNIPPDPPKP